MVSSKLGVMILCCLQNQSSSVAASVPQYSLVGSKAACRCQPTEPCHR